MGSKRELFEGVVNRINLIGIELEGGWDRSVTFHGRFDHDGSVKFEDPNYEMITDAGGRQRQVARSLQLPFPTNFIGEYVSKPMPVQSAADWIRTVYPNHVNKTCGLHIHMSFHNQLNYARLMTAEYLAMMVREMQQWATSEGLPADHSLWRRLDANDAWTQRYCAHQFLADNQVKVTKKHDYNSLGKAHSRYTFINYPDAQQHTVECRGLSMFGGMPTTSDDIEQAIRAVHMVITTTNRFLSKIRQREQKHMIEIVAKQPVIQEIGSVLQ